MTTFDTKMIRIAAASFLCAALLSCSSDYEFAYLYKDLPFEMNKVERPHIPAEKSILPIMAESVTESH